MKRILLICNYNHCKGGIANQVKTLQTNLEHEGYNVKLLSTSGSIIKRIYKIIELSIIIRKYDVIHAHGCSHWGFFPIVIGTFLAKLAKIKLVVTYHGGDANNFFSKYPKFIRFVLNKADTVITLSEFLKSIFDSFHIKSVVIPNTIIEQNNFFVEKEIISPNFLSIRSLTPIYNIQCIIKAFAILLNDIPNAQLSIIGDGCERAKLENYVLQNKINNITFVGFVPHERINYYLRDSDVFLSSPVIDNMPLSILESFQAGVLVISSNVGGVPYIVENEYNGYLFESNNHEQLAELMILAIKNQEKSLKMIHNAHFDFQKYTWENIKPLITEIYN